MCHFVFVFETILINVLILLIPIFYYFYLNLILYDAIKSDYAFNYFLFTSKNNISGSVQLFEEEGGG